ncbi:MAG TPA: hypothetical protein VM737_11960 [Gemmatimonadota bacterium]|nr:hypothetical protein [Gemmatimonadota bacterium]
MRADALRHGAAVFLAVIALGLALPPPAQGQDGGFADAIPFNAPPMLASYDEARYADEGRRDPFVPLVGSQSDLYGPRFEQLRLTGVFIGSPANSLVVLEGPDGRGHFLRVGQELGNARLVDIFSDGAAFEIRDYGSVRRETVRLDPGARPPARPGRAEAAGAPSQTGSSQPAPQVQPDPSLAPPEEGSPEEISAPPGGAR